MPQPTRRDLLTAGLGAVAACAAAPAPASVPFSFRHDHILGTSLDITGAAPSLDVALRAEDAALGEIERLRAVFSVHDPESELSRFAASSGPVRVSDDLRAVMAEYGRLRTLSGGACSPATAALSRLWAEAARSGEGPDVTALREATREAVRPAWHLDGDIATRLGSAPLDLNSAAKGYILQKAADAVRPLGLPALLVNLGGDLCGWGGCVVGVQDPASPADNAPPLAALWLGDGAAATSGGYQRYHDVAGRRHSHLIDPRTGRPADGVASATVTAADATTANGLATLLCILKPAEGLRLVRSLPGVECLLVTPSGEQIRSDGFCALEPVADELPAKGAKADGWPEGFQVAFALELLKPTTGRKARRPYVAIWIEGADGKPVRTVTVWGNSPKWLPTMSGWWKVGGGDRALVKAVTRATRGPGKYEIVWDGKDDRKQSVPRGTYTVKVEVHREHGKHVFQTGKIECGAEGATLTLEKNAEAGDTVVTYGKKK